MKTNAAGRRLRQSQMDQYNASALYGLGAVDKTTHDVSYAAAGGPGSIAGDLSAALRNNEYARTRLQRLVGTDQPPCRGDGVPYGLPCRGGRLPPPLMPGVVEHIYESPDLVRRDAAVHDEQYTPTNAPGQQPPTPTQSPPHRGYWPLPVASHPSPGTKCCDSSPQSGLKAKNAGNYSL